jgi:signal transduction histidine kinase
MDSESVPAGVRVEVEAERASEDRAIALERTTDDDRLQAERDERERALAALLYHERGTTDERLLSERARADEAIASRDEFLGIVSHDIRALLGGMALSAGMLARRATTEGTADPATASYAERMQRLTARMNRLVGDLLDVVSLEAGKLEVLPVAGNVAPLVREAADAFAAPFAAKGVTLVTEVGTSLRATFDHDRILQVLANLLGNALKFTPAGGRVVLAATTDGDDRRLSVADSGVGISAADVEVVFERFRQVNPRDRRGLGLGLFIAKSIVEAHGGRIWIEASAVGGTTVCFTLPAAITVPTSRA